MKFVIRDDDLNFFFDKNKIEKDFAAIWNICPISMSVVPFIKGYWPIFIKEAEERGPGFVDNSYISSIRTDDKVYPIGDNEQLVNFIKGKIADKKVYLTIHAIHHRNEDKIIPQFSGNYGIGAEFYTDRDLTKPLAQAIEYLQRTFGQNIDVFTPPQNLLSPLGLKAVIQNELSICADLPSPRKAECLKLFGSREYIKYVYFKTIHRGVIYPYPIRNRRLKWIAHKRLQPGTDIGGLYTALENAYRFNGCFVVSTHSYGFDRKMNNSETTVGDVLKRLIDYATQKSGVQFTNIKEILGEKL